MMQNMTALTRCGPLTNANKVSTAARAPSLNISRITRQTALEHPLLEARLEQFYFKAREIYMSGALPSTLEKFIDESVTEERSSLLVVNGC